MSTIIQDANEAKFFTLPFQVRIAPIAFDYLVVGTHYTVAVERKSLLDFFSSISDGRLFAQATAARKACDVAVVVTEPMRFDADGVLIVDQRPLKQPTWTQDHLFGAALTLAGIGCLLLFIPRSGFPAFLLRAAAWADQLHEVNVRDAAVRTANLSPQVAALSHIPGIGPVRAKQILEHYTSFIDAVLDYQNWVRLRGIGKTRLESVERFMRGK